MKNIRPIIDIRIHLAIGTKKEFFAPGYLRIDNHGFELTLLDYSPNIYSSTSSVFGIYVGTGCSTASGQKHGKLQVSLMLWGHRWEWWLGRNHR